MVDEIQKAPFLHFISESHKPTAVSIQRKTFKQYERTSYKIINTTNAIKFNNICLQEHLCPKNISFLWDNIMHGILDMPFIIMALKQNDTLILIDDQIFFNV